MMRPAVSRSRREAALTRLLATRSHRSLIALVTTLCVVASLLASVLVYRLTGLDLNDPTSMAVGYGLPVGLPLVIMPLLLWQVLRLVTTLERRTASLEEEVERRMRAEARLALLASTDELTQLPNRREFFNRAAQVDGTHMAAVALLDLDNFKAVNDHIGHAGGDDALRRCGAVLIEACVEPEFAARLGGEEFGILLPATTLDGAARRIDEIRRAIARAGGLTSASAGIAAWEPTAESIDQALARADRALYRAKRRGRDRVEVARLDDSPAPGLGVGTHRGSAPGGAPARQLER